MSQGKRSAGEEPAIAALPCGVESLWRLSAAGRSRQKNAPRDRRRLAHGTCQTFTEGRGTTYLFLKKAEFDCYEDNGKLSEYLFDAHYDDSQITELITSVRFLNPGVKEKLILHKEDTEAIYSMSLALPGDELYVSDGTEPQELDMQIHPVPHPGPFTFSNIPSVPGIYKGFLSGDNRIPGGVAQKSVDTMLTLCGILKANEGRSIVLFSGDAVSFHWRTTFCQRIFSSF